jgi:hypothetical protein
VSHACADDETYDHPHKEFVGPVIWAALVLVQLDLYQIAQIDAYRPQQSIPTNTSIAKMDEDRVNVPNN